MKCAGFQKAAICLWVSRTLTAGSGPDAPIMCCWQNSWKSERGIWVQQSPNCSLLWRMMDLNTTQRKILNAGNLSLTIVCWNHWNLMLSEENLQLRNITWGYQESVCITSLLTHYGNLCTQPEWTHYFHFSFSYVTEFLTYPYNVICENLSSHIYSKKLCHTGVIFLQ